MSPASKEALDTLRRMARGHAGASSGEEAAWEILQNFQAGTPVNFAGGFVRLDGTGKRAVVQLMVELATGETRLGELG
jgi:hypothetical protein